MKQSAALPDRGVGHNGHFVLLAPRQQVEFNSPMFGVVEHLVDRAGVPSTHMEQFLHVIHVEVRDAPGPNLALLQQAVEGRNCIPKGKPSRPVKKVEVDRFHPETFQARLARLHCSLQRSVRWKNLAHQMHAFAQPVYRFSYQDLRAPAAVHLGIIDHRHPQLNSTPERSDLRCARGSGIANVPGPLSKLRYPAPANFKCLHNAPNVLPLMFKSKNAVILSDRTLSAAKRQGVEGPAFRTLLEWAQTLNKCNELLRHNNNSLHHNSAPACLH